MASTFQNTEFKLPFNDLTKYIPSQLKNEMNVSLMDNLFNRFMTHDESVPFYGYIGDKPNSPDDKSPPIPHRTLESKVNTITPILSFKTGETKHVFTVQDLTRKAKALGIAVDGQGWLYSQENNFLPPIDIDKFVNFSEYFWVADALATKPTFKWNLSNKPEYYVIARPTNESLIKRNVDVATTENTVLTGSGFETMQLEVLFHSSPDRETNNADTFTVTVNGLPNGLEPTIESRRVQLLNDDTTNYTLKVQKTNDTSSTEIEVVSFSIVQGPIYSDSGNVLGHSAFKQDDKYLINVEPVSRRSTFKFVGSAGVKGALTQLEVIQQYQTVDGATLSEDMRILVKNQDDATQNGIYVVTPNNFVRSEDYTADLIVSDAKVWILNGDQNANTLWISDVNEGAVTWQHDVTAQHSMTNDWQEGNFWVYIDELERLEIDRSSVTQAQRPIIEFANALQLNEYVTRDLKPSSKEDGAIYVRQTKEHFNQLPLFNLYRYDGTHSGMTSSLFYYEEDERSTLDPVLQIRPKRASNGSGDFMFNHGFYDTETDQLLFAKDLNGNLVSTWHAGYSAPVVSEVLFQGAEESVGAELKVAVTNKDTPQQVWYVTAITPKTFTVSGTKNKNNPELTVGIEYTNSEVSILVEPIETGYQVGDTFVFRVGNREAPVLVQEDEHGNIVVADGTTDETAWAVSRSFYQNPYYGNRSELEEGTVYSHFRSILNNQVKGLPLDPAFGGNIKLWSEQHNLFASLLMQRDMTPITIVDLAEKMYENSLNNIKDIYFQNIIDIVSQHGIQSVDSLLDDIININTTGELATQTLNDSTSPIKGFPITLPQMGCAPLVEPAIVFSQELGLKVLRHHDGHFSELYQDGQIFRHSILGNFLDKKVLRSDGTETKAVGSMTSVPPSKPYKDELWSLPDGRMMVYDVDYDTYPPLSASIGQTWFDRISGKQFIRVELDWEEYNENLWKPIDFAEILNALMLKLETRLYTGINANIRQIDFKSLERDPYFSKQLRDEFFSFAALNSYDPTFTDFDATKPFTWNYSNVDIDKSAPVSTENVPARWFNYLKSHQSTIAGVIPTSTPHLEPWKLLGYESRHDWFSGLAEDEVAEFTPTLSFSDLVDYAYSGDIAAYAEATSEPLVGRLTVDGYRTSVGDLVITNGKLWTVRNTEWEETEFNTEVPNYKVVVNGASANNTVWTKVGDNLVQVRELSRAAWDFIKANRPGLKLSVNTINETLLPPYVQSTHPEADNALTSVLPVLTNAPYVFGEDGPIEYIWKQTLNYNYTRVRALIKYDPILFLGFGWGFNWVNVNGIQYDSFNISVPSHTKFKLHGENIPLVVRNDMEVVNGVSEKLYNAVIATYDGYAGSGVQSFSIRTTSGDLIGYTVEGQPTDINGMSFAIEDFGVPFRIGDRFELSFVDGAPASIFVPIPYHTINGFGQIFSNALRYSSISSQNSYAINAYRGWDVNMGYRAEGLVSTDSLIVRTNNLTLTSQSYDLVVKKNEHAHDTWIQALRISITKVGSDSEKIKDIFRPTSRGEDWEFRIEGFNPRYTKLKYYELDFDTDPYCIDEHGNHIPNCVLDESVLGAAGVVTFRSLNGKTTDNIWLRPTVKKRVVQTNLPLVIRGIQNVINFLFGYADMLEDEGWRFNNGDKSQVDAETGRGRGYQLEIEKFINEIYVGLSLDAGSIVNPFIDRVWYKHDTGLMSEFVDTSLFDITATPGVFDMLGVKYNKSDLNIIRRNDMSSIGAVGPIFSAHAQSDEYEHVFIFKNYAHASTQAGLLYDPFSGSHIKTYMFNGRRQQSNVMRPEFGGYYLENSKVHQNMQASTDTVQNLYDATHVFENEKTTNNALALLGFHQKQYFADLDITSASQFNFWRGMIQYKGTNMSIDAYLNNNRFDDAYLDEFWAYKVAEYGDARTYKFPELKVQTGDVSSQFTQYQFDAIDEEGNLNLLPGFTHVESIDESRWYSLDDLNTVLTFDSKIVGTYKGYHAEGDIVKLAFIADKLLPGTGCDFEVINATTIRVTSVSTDTQNNFVVNGYAVNTDKYTPIKLFNYRTSDLVKEIPVWHPAAGQHNPFALESVNVISDVNPAKFNYSTLISSNFSYDPARIWGKKEVGRIWFDTTNLHYVPYYDATVYPNLGERLSRWGMLADYGSVDVCEWVESTVHPSEYIARAQDVLGDTPTINKIDGEVANADYYSRTRNWYIRPIAWAFTPNPAPNVEWEDKPPFKAHVSGTKINTLNDMIVLDNHTFKSIGITPGMHIGGWLRDGEDSKILSEYEVTSSFTKQLQDIDGNELGNTAINVNGLNAIVSVEVIDDMYNPDLVQQISVLPTEILSQPSELGEGGIPVAYQVDTMLKVFAPDINIMDSVLLTTNEARIPAEIVTTSVTNAEGQETVDSRSSSTTETSSVETGNRLSTSVSQVTETVEPNDEDQETVEPGDEDPAPSTVSKTIVSETESSNKVNAEIEGTENTKGSAQANSTSVSTTVTSSKNVSSNVPSAPLYGSTLTAVKGQKWEFTLPKLGIKIVVTSNSDGTFPVNALGNLISTALGNRIFVKDAVKVVAIVPVSSGETEWENPDDNYNPLQMFANPIGWVAWEVPTQQQLLDDARKPMNSWIPFIGDPVLVDDVYQASKDAVAYAKDPLITNDGTVVDRYHFDWTGWSKLRDIKQEKTQISNGALEFVFNEPVPADRTSVYINGSLQLQTMYSITSKKVIVHDAQYRSFVTVIIRKYEPKQSEVNVGDNLAYMTDYKLDYEYTEVPVRGVDGGIVSSLYYFWVKNRSVASPGKRMSVRNITQELVQGPANSINFHRSVAKIDDKPPVYNGVTLTGLSSLVTKDDTFKLRFTNDHTLRLDPNGLDLKNVHTEWTLIRPNMRGLIPETLWWKLVDSAVGYNLGGNPVPALRRSLYDERNGTRTQFGFGPEQTLAPSELLKSSLLNSIINTKLVIDSIDLPIPDYIDGLDYDNASEWFVTPESTRKTLTDIWTLGTPEQINDIFFSVLDDILSSNYELTDLFKTSRLSAHSIKVVRHKQ